MEYRQKNTPANEKWLWKLWILDLGVTWKGLRIWQFVKVSKEICLVTKTSIIMNLKVNSRPVLREKKKKKTKEEEEEEKCSQRGKRISFLFFF